MRSLVAGAIVLIVLVWSMIREKRRRKNIRQPSRRVAS